MNISAEHLSMDGSPSLSPDELCAHKTIGSIDTQACTGVPSLDELMQAPDGSLAAFSCEERLNGIPGLQDFLKLCHRKLRPGGVLVVAMETVEERKERLCSPLPQRLRMLAHLADFCAHRVLPKLPYVRKIYFKWSGNRIVVMAKAELLGRLVATGFAIGTTRVWEGVFTVVAHKSKATRLQRLRTGAILLRLERVGQGGKLFNVYKLRTMSRFSEYLQDYIHTQNNLAKGGKFENDFRITSWGRLFRRTWIDELPMIYNWIRGEVCLIGVRPLTRHYFSLYSERLQHKRILLKPGLIPPYYADLPNTLQEVQASEERYIDAFLENPWRTQLSYFWRAFCNIVIRGARSR